MTTVHKNYSQSEEQIYILAALAGIKEGRFLDVGAWHPEVFSNTRALYEEGWGGVMIEPSPEPFLSLLKAYGTDERIELICAAVGVEPGLAKLWTTADAVSTTQIANYDKWKGTAKFDGAFWTPRITFRDIFNQFGAFQFVSIDAEGTSVELCSELMRTAMRPQCICVEHDGRMLELAQIMQQAGYQQSYASGENCVWVLR